MKYVRLDILFRKIGMVGYTFSKNWYKERVFFEASMAGPRPKSGQVHPPGNNYVFTEKQLETSMLFPFQVALMSQENDNWGHH